ncbi:D-aminoacyl-tRNA deacylase [Lachnoanaerobaculum umeaense]|jgi:D-tyrosyl-tRNA(Tyr) deacylase|uniref:D-aminoacyl-tRNA deacylase n=1 Tax=Lachnoanaerobaculum umeaense TaxID=617123 RepID=A0A385PX46_9FIRM|nr:D-aminoacyl-tRNA deacylase [Lachnoanaerobaculum umeaense]AYA98572.1 D-tyrosyl-tRNA(Tyr) deacylase [Lachnoanaerobaculum umeaense]PZW97840.1 D-tyrosyl-tRNA(Tyr) deacylase [Lachnoanaerobaculum umeaense]
MKLVIQRVNYANVKIDGEEVGKIKKGLLVLVGVAAEDDEKIVEKYFNKLIKLRIFEDENGKTNLSLKDVGGELLLVSQFTLLANCKEGNRPSFIGAGSPDEAKRLYEYMVELGKKSDIHTESGVFGADMKVSLENDGPFTIVLEL